MALLVGKQRQTEHDCLGGKRRWCHWCVSSEGTRLLAR